MRIVHVSDCFLPGLGGIETQVAGLALHQSADGHDVTVLTCQPGRTQWKPYRVLRSAWDNPMGWPINPAAPRQFLRMIDQLQPDVVHVHVGEVTPVAQAMLPTLAREGQNTVISVHSVWNEKATVPLAKIAVGAAGLRESALKWAGVSELVASRLRQVLPAPQVSILPNGVDAKFWQVEPRPHEDLLAVAATRFAPRKRVPELLRMLAETGAHAVLAGDGPGFASAQRYVEEHDLPVELPGRLTAIQLRRLYSRADVYLAPGLFEAASIAAAEAQAAGLAILTRSQSGLGERISPNEGACADTDQQFAQILSEWVADPALVEPIKDHNRTTLCPMDWSLSLPKAYALYAS